MSTITLDQARQIIIDLENTEKALAFAEVALSKRYDPASHSEIQEDRNMYVYSALCNLNDSAATEACLNIIKAVGESRHRILTTAKARI